MNLHVSDWYSDSRQREVLLIAGSNGMNRTVAGTHIIEKPDFGDFLSGREIIFTTGVALTSMDEITQIARASLEAGASALVLNTGMYIKTVPEDTIIFCNENNFPLFTVPWHVHIEALIQSVYSLVSEKEGVDGEAKRFFETAIANPEHYELYVDDLRKLGFSSNWGYCVGLIYAEETPGSGSSVLQKIYDKIQTASESGRDFIFPYISAHNIVVIFANVRPKEAEEKIRQYLKDFQHEKIVFSIGRSTKSIRCLEKSYSLAQRILSLKLSGSLPSNIISYDELGIYKVMIALENQDILNQIVEEYFKPLLDYDRLCGTDYASFIRIYLKCDGHIKNIADEMFIHKNTVYYKIKKIEEILDCDLSRYDVKTYLMIAVMSTYAKESA